MRIKNSLDSTPFAKRLRNTLTPRYLPVLNQRHTKRKLGKITSLKILQPRPNLITCSDDDDEDQEPSSGRRSRSRAINQSDVDESEENTPHKIKRKKLIYENTAARELREQDQERRAAQEERRKKLLANQAKFGDSNTDSQIIINASKHDEEGFIFVNDKIARRIKTHQVEGVRFLWDQVMAGQGCLLAHTMGLGKTMQVITLLVAIAEAALSPNESISNQIPSNIRDSKTLVLCPPTLIDNWMDELLIWAPTDSLGPLRKVDSTIKSLNQRWAIIDNWYNHGGVLIMGYEMFRHTIENKKSRKQEAAPIEEELHARIKMKLTEGPSIIIADEAHKRTFPISSFVGLLCSQFELLYRIFRSMIDYTATPWACSCASFLSLMDSC